jgi:hypothetical protein
MRALRVLGIALDDIGEVLPSRSKLNIALVGSEALRLIARRFRQLPEYVDRQGLTRALFGDDADDLRALLESKPEYINKVIAAKHAAEHPSAKASDNTAAVRWSEKAKEEFRCALRLRNACEAKLAIQRISESLCLHEAMEEARRKLKVARLPKQDLNQTLRAAKVIRGFVNEYSSRIVPN